MCDPRTSQNGKSRENTTNSPIAPDGGARAWSVMVSSFLCNGIIFGLINSYSIIYIELHKQLKDSGENGSSSKAALAGSLTIGTTFFLSPISGILIDKLGMSLTTFVGGVMACVGLLLSSFVGNRIELLYITYGIMFGIGASLSYTPSLVILGHYFNKHMGIVNGFVSTGSSVFSMAMPYILDYLITRYNIAICFRLLSLSMGIIIVSSFLFKPLKGIETKPSAPFMNKEIWTNSKYIGWAIISPIGLIGYFVPFVHIGKFVDDNYQGHDPKILMFCIGITSGIGRIVFGKIADYPKVDKIFLQQFAFFFVGISTMLMTVGNDFAILIMITIVLGIFDGCFVSLLGPIAFDITGREGAGQAIGFMLGFCSIPMTIGAPIAGMLYDNLKSYTVPFLIAGIPSIMSAFLLYPVNKMSTGNKMKLAGDSKEIEQIREVEETNQSMSGKANQGFCKEI